MTKTVTTGEGDQALLRRVEDAYLPGASAIHGAHPSHARRADEPLGPQRRYLAGRLPAEVEEDAPRGEDFVFHV